MEKNKLNKATIDYKVFLVVAYVFIGIVSVLGVVPFLMMLSGSFTSEREIINHGYSLWISDFSTGAYTSIFENATSIFRAYGVTIFVTLTATVLSLFFSSMTAYVLQRKDFEWRNKLSYFIYFTTLFSGGLTPWYMLMMKMGMKNNIVALIIPHLFAVFNILIMRNYMSSIPHEIAESAKVDGANDFVIYLKLIMPLSKPVLATIALFAGLVCWNEWYNCMLFISDTKLYTLQYYLYNMLNNATAMKELVSGTNFDVSSTELPTESTKLAMSIIATGPILLLYPFIQKYFVKGIVIGAVKG